MNEHPIESMFYAHLADPKATRKSVAVCYAMLMSVCFGRQKAGESTAGFWPPIHDAIRERFDLTILQIDPIKKAAWALYEATAERRRATQ